MSHNTTKSKHKKTRQTAHYSIMSLKPSKRRIKPNQAHRTICTCTHKAFSASDRDLCLSCNIAWARTLTANITILNYSNKPRNDHVKLCSSLSKYSRWHYSKMSFHMIFGDDFPLAAVIIHSNSASQSPQTPNDPSRELQTSFEKTLKRQMFLGLGKRRA